MIAPTTNLKLVKVDLALDNLNQINFQNSRVQLNYFNSLPHLDVDDFTYQRKDNTIRYPNLIDNIIEYNYVLYQNESHTDKWYYAFITKMEYANDNMTLIQIKTDVFQTWQFDVVYKQSFIEREHVNDDTIGLHTIPENLETGDYIIQGSGKQMNYNGDFVPCVALTKDILIDNPPYNNHMYNGVVSGLTFVGIQSITDIRNLLLLYTTNTNVSYDDIYAMFMIPESFLELTDWRTDKTGTIHFKYINETKNPFEIGNITLQKPIILGESPTGYKPVNNKLLTYPYCYLYVTNNTGSDITYQYELFTPQDGSSIRVITFDSVGSIDIGCSIKIVPNNYKSQNGRNYAYAINGGKLPVGSWVGDVFTNWITQNGVNIATSLVANGLQLAGSYRPPTYSSEDWKTDIGTFRYQEQSSKGGVSPLAFGSGLVGVANTLSSIYEHKMMPEQVNGNVNSSNIMFSLGMIAPTFYQMSIKIEYAKIIDQFFSMYGYKVNTLKIPNIMGRKNWNYVKTVGCNIEGHFPQEDLEELKTMFNNGITIWHNTATFLDYSQENGIV